MSVAAPAIVKAETRIVVVRLADVAEAVGGLSVIFGVLLVVFPVAFPRMIVSSWEHGQLMPILMFLSFVVDTCLYIRIAYMLSAKPRIVAAACLGSLPLLVVGGLSVLLQRAVSYTVSLDLPNLHARLGEEILAHTYLDLVCAVFLPFLVIRLLQQLKANR